VPEGGPHANLDIPGGGPHIEEPNVNVPHGGPEIPGGGPHIEDPNFKGTPHGEDPNAGGFKPDKKSMKDMGDGHEVGLDENGTPIMCSDPCLPLQNRFKDEIAGLKGDAKTKMLQDLEELDNMIAGPNKVARTQELATELNNIKNGIKGLSVFKVAAKYGIDSYKNLKKILGSGSGYQVHHLFEQRFAKTLKVIEDEMESIVLTIEEHANFTKAWRDAIPYKNSTSLLKTTTALPEDIYNAAKKIYKDYPDILKALGL
jgi:hypothetical protein